MEFANLLGMQGQLEDARALIVPSRAGATGIAVHT
jgi:hypothetical protein